jgi:hypothetical protein
MSIGAKIDFEHVPTFYKFSYNSFFIYDHTKRELHLLDRNLVQIKTIELSLDYHCVQYKFFASKLICNVSNQFKKKNFFVCI